MLRPVVFPTFVTIFIVICSVMIAFVASGRTAHAAPPGPFACEANAGVLSWTDHDQSKYWTYKQTPDSNEFAWMGKTLGATTIADRYPAPGTRYQVHYQGIPRATCTVTAEPTVGVVDPGPFTCESDGGVLTWPDRDQAKYWTYRAAPGSDSFVWLGKTLGATTLTDPAPTVGTRYQVHYQGIPRTICTIAREPGDETLDPFVGLPFDTGQIVAADYASVVDATEVWNYVTNGFFEGNDGYDPSVDTQIVHRSTGGDPLPALDGVVHPAYRSMNTYGPQSRWDAEFQPDHTRSQLGGWGRYSTIHVAEEGDRDFIVYSLRLEPETPIPGSVLRHTGLYWLSMVSQVKSFLPSGNEGPVIAVYEGYDGLQFRVREGDGHHDINITDVPRGVWLRIGIDVLWSSGDDGAYRWWADLDGDETVEFEPLSERRATATIRPGFEAAALNIGPYHTDQVPENGRDYANVEILSHPADDPWN